MHIYAFVTACDRKCSAKACRSDGKMTKVLFIRFTGPQSTNVKMCVCPTRGRPPARHAPCMRLSALALALSISNSRSAAFRPFYLLGVYFKKYPVARAEFSGFRGPRAERPGRPRGRRVVRRFLLILFVYPFCNFEVAFSCECTETLGETFFFCCVCRIADPSQWYPPCRGSSSMASGS